MRRVEVPPEAVARLVAGHDAGRSTLALARELGVSLKVARRVLREHGRGEGRLTMGDDHVFDGPVDTPAKAYWLGFLAGDGFVGPGFVRLKLGPADRDHLAEFARFTGRDPAQALRTEVHPATGHACGYVDCCSVHLVRRLGELGLTPGKAKRTVVPDVPMDLRRHLLRGLVDADGCIDERARRLYICCTPALGAWVNGYLNAVLGLPPARLHEVPGTRRLYVSRPAAVLDALTLMYAGAPWGPALARKRAAARRCMLALMDGLSRDE